ncbi:unnamed protein product [Chondrus crispus]|uniref:Uncharacterized protein n=1 Tax=Chondrus crispus TaxID=2769 RepID=R7Q4S7_CHOCR|nr:unnamed protein product [Chondrus crispus]CDF33537.1 unnamed protein product [Chondrus crispus]|eukprot:XP_005713340.1 unnamed protein product [Chondrus crispus]
MRPRYRTVWEDEKGSRNVGMYTWITCRYRSTRFQVSARGWDNSAARTCADGGYGSFTSSVYHKPRVISTVMSPHILLSDIPHPFHIRTDTITLPSSLHTERPLRCGQAPQPCFNILTCFRAWAGKSAVGGRALSSPSSEGALHACAFSPYYRLGNR